MNRHALLFTALGLATPSQNSQLPVHASAYPQSCMIPGTTAQFMASEDKAVLHCLKASATTGNSISAREKAKTLADKAAMLLKDSVTRAALVRIADSFRSRTRMAEIGQKFEPPFAEMGRLGTAGLVKSAEFAWLHVGDAIHELPFGEIVACAPSIRVLDLIAKKHRDLSERLSTLLRDQPHIANTSAALDWLVARAKPKELMRFGPMLLENQHRSAHLAPMSELLGGALLRDKPGALFRELLTLTADNVQAAGRLCTAIQGSPKLLVQIISGFPKILAKREAALAIPVLESLLAGYPKTPLAAREGVSSAMAALAAHLLRNPKRKAPEQRALDFIAGNARTWMAALDNAKDYAGFWLTCPASEMVSSGTSGTDVSMHGAGLLAISMDKAKAGFGAQALLEALAFNLGMELIGKVGDRVVFDPSLHEDAVGGLLEGDAAVVRGQGWRLGERVIRRCKVTPN